MALGVGVGAAAIGIGALIGGLFSETGNGNEKQSKRDRNKDDYQNYYRR